MCRLDYPDVCKRYSCSEAVLPPVFDWLQQAIWRGKAREIWSWAITSGRQLVWGRCQQRISKPILVMSVTGLEDKSIHKAASIQFDFRNVRGLFDVKQELIWLATAPCVYNICLPDDITRDQISQVFPLCICIYCKSSNTGGGRGLLLGVIFWLGH